MIESLVLLTLSSYCLTFIITSSSIMAYFRNWFKTKTPRLAILGNKHFIECRMCMGCWVSLATVLVLSDITMWLPVYGASYWLCTQEKN